jgi:hypothetical protein
MRAGERHLKRLLTTYVTACHCFRTPRWLTMDCPHQRPRHLPERGKMIAGAGVGGLHHHTKRRAA